MSDIFVLEVRERPFFTGKGKIKQRDILTMNLSLALSQIVTTDKKIRDAYNKYLSDSRLVGQDKADILEDIGDMIINVVTLRLYIAKKIFGLSMVDTVNREKGYQLKIFLSSYEFLLTGYFSRKLLKQISTFHYWDETLFMPLYENLLNAFKTVVSDGQITPEEGSILAGILDDMLHMLVLIFYKLESEFIDE